MDTSDIIAILALVVSTIVAVAGYCQSKKQNASSLNAYYFNEIYSTHLIKNIPNARKRLTINYKGKIVGYEDLVKEMKSIQKDSLYYKYTDKAYFVKLKKAAQGIEDYITNNLSRTFEGEEQTDFLNTLYEKIENLYRVINDKYMQ